jgi:hypothetical protein
VITIFKNEKSIFQIILNDVIQHHKYRKQTRADRAKIERIEKQPIKMVGIAHKLMKKTNNTITKKLYLQYEGKRFINNTEKKLTFVWKHPHFCKK